VAGQTWWSALARASELPGAGKIFHHDTRARAARPTKPVKSVGLINRRAIGAGRRRVRTPSEDCAPTESWPDGTAGWSVLDRPPWALDWNLSPSESAPIRIMLRAISICRLLVYANTARRLASGSSAGRRRSPLSLLIGAPPARPVASYECCRPKTAPSLVDTYRPAERSGASQ
jgi:hypothetical protein